MKKTNQPKLSLTTSTVRRLNTLELENVGGGFSGTPTLCNCQTQLPTQPHNTQACN
jgi:hypothetical protein